MKITDQDVLAHLQSCYGGKWRIQPVSEMQPIVRTWTDTQYGRSITLRMDMVEKMGDRWKRWVDRQFAPMIGV